MPNIGPRLRELRLSRGLTLEQVAADTGFSVSFLSMLERDKVSVSVDNLEKLARYYQVHMVYFFPLEADNQVLVTRRADILRRMAENGKSPASVTLLANRPDPRMEPLLVHVAPGREEPHFREHEADTLVYIVSGCARLVSETGEEIILEQGDVAYYVNRPHRRIINASQSEPLTLLLITAPPTSSLEELLKARQGVWVMSEQK